MMDVLCPEDTFYIKEEFEDDSCMDNEHFISETAISANNGESRNSVWTDCVQVDFSSVDIKTESLSDVPDSIVNENVEIKCEVDVVNDIKIEIDEDDELLFCEQCRANYEDYCTTCGMLVRILTRNVLSKTDNRVQEEIPLNILEIRDSIAQVGIFALRVIPEGVKFGPFIGLDTAEYPWKMKGGRFVESSDKSVLLNWMQYINPARNTTEQNLLAFQCDDNLYYESNREIQKGEELLVYFGGEYNHNLNKDIEIDFLPTMKDDLKDVFACTFCCLGFSSREYLTKHKSTCLFNRNKELSAGELMQCSFCKIYMDVTEYSEHHISYCCETNARKHIPLVVDSPPEMYKGKPRHHKTHKDLTDTEGNLRKHMMKTHSEVVEYKCHSCEYITEYKHSLQMHIKTKHLKEFDYKCDACAFKTNQKFCYQYHVKTKHLKEFDYECDSCEFKSNRKTNFKNHMQTQHLEEFDYKCTLCECRIKRRRYFQNHFKTESVGEFDYKCSVCEYMTNRKRYFQNHFKTKSLEEFKYECDLCEFKTNYKRCLEWHGKRSHSEKYRVTRVYPKKISYKCGNCEFKANTVVEITMHIKTIHPQPEVPKFVRAAAPLIDKHSNAPAAPPIRTNAIQPQPEVAKLFGPGDPLIYKHSHTPAAPPIRTNTIQPQPEVPRLFRPGDPLIYKHSHTPAAPPIQTNTIQPQPEVLKFFRPADPLIDKHLRTSVAQLIRTNTIHPKPAVPKLFRTAVPLIDKHLLTPAAPPIRTHLRIVSKIVKANFTA